MGGVKSACRPRVPNQEPEDRPNTSETTVQSLTPDQEKERNLQLLRAIGPIGLKALPKYTLEEHETVGAITRVIDGDTYDLTYVLVLKSYQRAGDLPILVTKETITLQTETIRLFGVDAAEKKTEAGKQIKTIVETWVETHPEVTIVFSKDEKFGRRMGRIIGLDGQDLGEFVLSHKGLAVPYHGENKAKAWNKEGLTVPI